MTITKTYYGPCDTEWSAQRKNQLAKLSTSGALSYYGAVASAVEFQCLQDATPLTKQVAPKGLCKGYHWKLENFEHIRNTTVDERHITFHVIPCYGMPALYVTPIAGFPTPATAWYSTNQTKNHHNHSRGTTLSMNLALQWAEFYVSVCSSEEEATEFSIIGFAESKYLPAANQSNTKNWTFMKGTNSVYQKPNNTAIKAEHKFPVGTLQVEFETMVDPAYSYTIFYRDINATEGAYDVCAMSNKGVINNKSHCLLWTQCGLERMASKGGTVKGSTLVTTSSGSPTRSSINVSGLDINRQYYVNILASKTIGNKTFSWVYDGAIGETQYHKVTQLVSNDVNIIIGCVVGGLVLLFCIVLFALNAQYRHGYRLDPENTEDFLKRSREQRKFQMKTEKKPGKFEEVEVEKKEMKND